MGVKKATLSQVEARNKLSEEGDVVTAEPMTTNVCLKLRSVWKRLSRRGRD